MKKIPQFFFTAIGGFVGVYFVKAVVFSETISWGTQDIMGIVVAPIIFAAYLTYWKSDKDDKSATN
ncbi:MAG: hypothetical protein ACI30S_04530 [Muribaculaceae bacterium]